MTKAPQSGGGAAWTLTTTAARRQSSSIASGCEHVRDQTPVRQLANAGRRIAGNPLPQLGIGNLPAVGVGRELIVHGEGVAARAMEGKFAAFAAHGEGTPIGCHQDAR